LTLKTDRGRSIVFEGKDRHLGAAGKRRSRPAVLNIPRGDRRVPSTRRPAGFANDAATVLVDRTPFDKGTARRRSRAEACDPDAAPEPPRVRPVHTPTTRGTPAAPPPSGCRPASARPPCPHQVEATSTWAPVGTWRTRSPTSRSRGRCTSSTAGPLPDPLITSLTIGTVGTDCRVARVGPTTPKPLGAKHQTAPHIGLVLWHHFGENGGKGHKSCKKLDGIRYDLIRHDGGLPRHISTARHRPESPGFHRKPRCIPPLVFRGFHASRQRRPGHRRDWAVRVPEHAACHAFPSVQTTGSRYPDKSLCTT
jgi:hypothetical protein